MMSCKLQSYVKQPNVHLLLLGLLIVAVVCWVILIVIWLQALVEAQLIILRVAVFAFMQLDCLALAVTVLPATS